MSEIDGRILALVDSVVASDEKRLPLLTLSEARAAIELLQLLSASNSDGSYAARHLAGNLARRLPAE
ncbi:hypothetical protein ACPCUV_29670 [Streptomyces platensis]|uniref:hypothetical protein n=1 Tax=Streptomyces platensis TaxID=58346 RepID=UPI003C2D24DF